jgi:membrane protease YdiL (CAAX protease family)
MNTVQSPPQVVEDSRRLQIALAWGAILILAAPRILLRLFVPAAPGEPISPDWLAWAQVAVLAALWAVSWVWPVAKPLRGFILALVAYGVGSFFVLPLIVESAAWLDWKQQASWGVWIVTDRLVTYLLLGGIMALTLIGSGIRRRELFLVRGNPSAPAQPSRFLAGGNAKKPVPWNRVALQFLPIYTIIAVIVLGIQLRPDVSQILQVLIYLPAIVLAAAIIAFAEEFMFRSMMLARLKPVVGAGQAALMAAGLFGLMHYFGWPGGPIGVLMAGYLGWWAARSMIDTRGFVWAFLLHFLGDFVIYAFAAVSPA